MTTICLEICKRIKEIRLEKNLTQLEFVAPLEITQGHLSQIEAGNKFPSDVLLLAICHVYGINKAWLKTGEGEKYAPKTEGEIGRLPTIPLVKKPIKSGLYHESAEDFVQLPGITDPTCIACISYGDSMAPTFKHGDLLIVKPMLEFESGDYVLAINNWDEFIVRRYRVKEDEIWLTADNQEYVPFKLQDKKLVVGKVLQRWRLEDFVRDPH